MLKTKRMPMPVNLNDCILLMQMGYSVEINDGKIKSIKKEKREREYIMCKKNMK